MRALWVYDYPLPYRLSDEGYFLGTATKLLRGNADWLQVERQVPKADREGRAIDPAHILEMPRNNKQVKVACWAMIATSSASEQDDPFGLEGSHKPVQEPIEMRTQRRRLRHQSITSRVPRKKCREVRPS